MKKRFKSKKKKNKFWFYFLFFIVIFIYLLVRYMPKNLNISNINSSLFNNVDRKKILLNAGLNFKEKIVQITNPVEPVFTEVIKPKIYLYNTHNREEYVGGNIMDATRSIKRLLSDKVDVTYEELDVVGLLSERNLNYNDAYLITKDLVRNNLNKDYSLYIDFHRDALAHNLSTVYIGGKSYAKVLFVIGALHDNYKLNYEVADHLNKKLKNINPDLSRGILVRERARYNQELNGNVLLIELGGNENNMVEINNTIEVLVRVIGEYLYE